MVTLILENPNFQLHVFSSEDGTEFAGVTIFRKHNSHGLDLEVVGQYQAAPGDGIRLGFYRAGMSAVRAVSVSHSAKQVKT